MNNKKYGVILADPPWSYRNNGVEGAAASQYLTTKTPALELLDVASISAKDSVLLMWATWPTLPDAMNLISSWGFSYVTGFPWVKLNNQPITNLFGEVPMYPFFGIGFWVRGCSEMVLIARRGKPELPKEDFLGLISKRMQHSRKPDNLYHYAESLNGPYLELFARRRREGWDAFGNEVEGSIEL